MKTAVLNSVMFAFVAGTTLFATGCKKEDLQPESKLSINDAMKAGIGDKATLQLDVDKFAGNIETYMNGKVSGYGYAIWHEGNIYYRGKGGGGWARRPIDAPALAHSAHIGQDIASSTKFITALATITLLERHNLLLTEKVYKYLPTNWKPSPSFKELTFERLLSHRTGLIKYGGDWEELKKTVEGPMDELAFRNKDRSYNNANFALLAIMLPYVSAKKEYTSDYNVLKSLENKTNQLYDALGQRYRGIVRVYVFKPAGFSGWDIVNFHPWNGEGDINRELGTKGYVTANGTEAGTTNGDYRRNGGAGGLYISAHGFGMVQTAAANGKIVSTQAYQVMKDKLLGFDGVVNGKYGKYYWKNGGANNRETIIFDFGKTQVAVFANSNTSEIGNKRSIMVGAYESAWVTK